MAQKVLAYIDNFNGSATISSWEALGEARKVAEALGGGVGAVILGQGVEGIAREAFEHGADEVLLADAPGLKDYRPETYASILAQAAKQSSAEAIILPTSGRTRELAGMTAVDLETRVTPDVIAF